MIRMLSFKRYVLLAASLLLLPASPIAAASFLVEIEEVAEWQVHSMGVGQWTPTDEDGVRTWDLLGPLALLDESNEVWGEISSWHVALKEDPFVTNNINVTNTSAFTQIFIVSVIMPIPAFDYDRVVNSSVAVTATDSNGDNQLLVDEEGGVPFYRGRVNNVTILPLTPPGLPLTTASCVPPSTPGCSTTSAAGVASMNVTPDTATELALVLRFALSPGDSVGITSRFEIVPEPTTGLLLALGLVGLAVRHRTTSR